MHSQYVPYKNSHWWVRFTHLGHIYAQGWPYAEYMAARQICEQVGTGACTGVSGDGEIYDRNGQENMNPPCLRSCSLPSHPACRRPLARGCLSSIAPSSCFCCQSLECRYLCAQVAHGLFLTMFETWRSECNWRPGSRMTP